MKAIRLGYVALAAFCATGTAEAAQPGAPAATVVAIPPMTTPDSGTRGNEMLAVAWQATQLIQADLSQTSEVMALTPSQKDYYSFPEVTAPTFSKWRDRGAKALVTGFVQSRSDGRYTVGCYVYDVDKGRELGRIRLRRRARRPQASRAQMLRPRLQGDHRLAGNVRHPHRLCRRNRRPRRPRETDRGDGQRRLQP